MRALLLPLREELTKGWIDVVHGTYPFETIGFLRTRKDRFVNPVGHRTEEVARAVLDAVFADAPDEDSLSRALDEIIRVRAIQDFPPETAVGIFFALKDLIRAKVFAAENVARMLPALPALETRIDAVVLMAFGAYARCREQIFHLKVEETSRRYSQILRLARKYGDVPEESDQPTAKQRGKE